VLLGAATYLHHRLIILRRWQRKLVLVFVKYPMLLVEPNCIPDLKFTLVALTHGELINISLTSSSVVYEVVLNIDCERRKKAINIPKGRFFHVFRIYIINKVTL
jgi:hypothetical protein